MLWIIVYLPFCTWHMCEIVVYILWNLLFCHETCDQICIHDIMDRHHPGNIMDTHTYTWHLFIDNCTICTRSRQYLFTENLKVQHWLYQHKIYTFIYNNTIYMCSGITSGRVLDGELLYIKILEVIICLHLPTDCVVEISLHSTGRIESLCIIYNIIFCLNNTNTWRDLHITY